MSSGAQAQIAASQAATEAQAQAAANALAFAKEQFQEAKTNRKPYLDAGASSTQMLMNLLGLSGSLVHNGSGSALRASGGASSGRNSSNPTTTGKLQGYPLGPLQTFPSGIQGREIIGGNPNGPNYFGIDDTSAGAGGAGGGAGGGTGGGGGGTGPRPGPAYGSSPDDRGYLSLSSGGAAATSPLAMPMVRMASASGMQTDVPASLVPSYQKRGFSVVR